MDGLQAAILSLSIQIKREGNIGPTIRRNATIGQGACILPGIIIGENSIVGANSVVTKNIPDLSLAIGVLARVIRKINNNEIKP